MRRQNANGIDTGAEEVSVIAADAVEEDAFAPDLFDTPSGAIHLSEPHRTASWSARRRRRRRRPNPSFNAFDKNLNRFRSHRSFCRQASQRGKHECLQINPESG